MGMPAIVEEIISFAQLNPLIAVAAALFIIFLIWRKPKLVLSILGIALILWFTIYLIMTAASSGKAQKEKLIEKEEKQLDIR